MTSFNSQTPVVMSIAAHDPCGSTGIQADIETCMSLGCHCTPIISALCAKDTRDIKEIAAIDSTLLIEQARAVLEDMPVTAIKLGFLGSVENIEAVHSILRDYPRIPLLVDPVINLAHEAHIDAPAIATATKALLLPMATLATPDLVEAHELAQQGDTLDACAREILEHGCEHLLISGSRRGADHIENSFYSQQGLIKHYRWQRLGLFSHGAGATLSAAICAYLAHGLRLGDAVEQGQQFAWQALEASRQLGMGKRIPNRIYWVDSPTASRKSGCN